MKIVQKIACWNWNSSFFIIFHLTFNWAQNDTAFSILFNSNEMCVYCAVFLLYFINFVILYFLFILHIFKTLTVAEWSGFQCIACAFIAVKHPNKKWKKKNNRKHLYMQTFSVLCGHSRARKRAIIKKNCLH